MPGGWILPQLSHLGLWVQGGERFSCGLPAWEVGLHVVVVGALGLVCSPGVLGASESLGIYFLTL